MLYVVKFSQRYTLPCVKGAVLLLACLLTAFPQAQTSQEATIVKHYDRGYSPLLRVYLTDVLKSVLDKTVSESGPYKLQFYSRFLSSNRSKLETERGELIDILFSSHWRGNFVNPDNVIKLDYPVFNGLLGLRSLIVTPESNNMLASINNLDDFKKLIAGQGANWVDVEILQGNALPVIEAQLFDALFPMLEKNRFHYLPLSILEAQTALQTKGLQYNRLSLNKDYAIFYPIPFYLFVNAERPELAERLKRGLEVAMNDGSIERLFNKHFGYVEPLMQESQKKLIVFNSPLLTPEKNQEVVDLFLSKYQSYFQFFN